MGIPMSSKPDAIGKQGGKTVFAIAGRLYTVQGVDIVSAKQAGELVASGQAVPVAKNYIDQFPWTKTK